MTSNMLQDMYKEHISSIIWIINWKVWFYFFPLNCRLAKPLFSEVKIYDPKIFSSSFRYWILGYNLPHFIWTFRNKVTMFPLLTAELKAFIYDVLRQCWVTWFFWGYKSTQQKRKPTNQKKKNYLQQQQSNNNNKTKWNNKTNKQTKTALHSGSWPEWDLKHMELITVFPPYFLNKRNRNHPCFRSR